MNGQESSRGEFFDGRVNINKVPVVSKRRVKGIINDLEGWNDFVYESRLVPKAIYIYIKQEFPEVCERRSESEGKKVEPLFAISKNFRATQVGFPQDFSTPRYSFGFTFTFAHPFPDTTRSEGKTMAGLLQSASLYLWSRRNLDGFRSGHRNKCSTPSFPFRRTIVPSNGLSNPIKIAIRYPILSDH